MEQEEKLLLIKDLCARLPYKVKVMIEYVYKPVVLSALFVPDISIVCVKYWDGRCDGGTTIEQVRPYLYPLSSMTDEQRKEFNDLSHWVKAYKVEGEYIGSSVTVVKCRELIDQYGEEVSASTSLKDYIPCIEWLNKNHFDYRGLIEKRLAIDCTNLNIY